jgi:hypothetical protein
MKHDFPSDKAYLDSLMRDAKKIVRLAHAHAKVCESFCDVLKESEAGSQPTQNAGATHHNPTKQLGSEAYD